MTLHKFDRITRALLLAGLVVTTGCLDSSADKAAATAQSAAAAPETKAVKKIPVRTVELVREDVPDRLDLTGTATPWDKFQVSSEVSGRIARLLVDEGEWVKKGQLLAELDREKREIELASRKAALERSRVELDFAQKRLARGEALLARGAISEAEVETLEQAVKVAENGVRVSEISIDSMMEEIEDTRVRAPISGQVSARHASLGETISAGAPFFTLIQIIPLKVQTEIPEPYLFKIRPGSTAELVFEAVSNEVFQGQIHFIQPMANDLSGAFPTEIRLANAGGKLQPGMIARVRITASILRQVLVAPLDAVVESKGETYVFCIEEGVARRKVVTIERRVGARAVITGPLEAGAQLVTEGRSNLIDGTAVEVIG